MSRPKGLHGRLKGGMGGILYTMPDSSRMQRCIARTAQERPKVRRLDDAGHPECAVIGRQRRGSCNYSLTASAQAGPVGASSSSINRHGARPNGDLPPALAQGRAPLKRFLKIRQFAFGDSFLLVGRPPGSAANQKTGRLPFRAERRATGSGNFSCGCGACERQRRWRGSGGMAAAALAGCWASQGRICPRFGVRAN